MKRTAPRRRGRTGANRSAEFPRGFTLPEVLLVLALLAILGAVSLTGLRRVRDAATLHGAARAVRGQMVLARQLAVGRRTTVRLTATPAGDLVLVDDADRVLASAGVGRSADLPVDSVRVRPATMRFNARGQAAPGSIYLFRGDRAVRLVCNFLGRVRQETLQLR